MNPLRREFYGRVLSTGFQISRPKLLKYFHTLFQIALKFVHPSPCGDLIRRMKAREERVISNNSSFNMIEWGVDDTKANATFCRSQTH